LTRTIIYLGVGCCLVVGAAAATILARASVPVAQTEGLSRPVLAAAQTPVSNTPVSNKEAKKDRLAVAALALADPQQVFPPVSQPVRQAYASGGPVAAAPPEVAVTSAIPPPKPKLAAKPPQQKNYALLSDAQIAAIKGRLNLSSSQESYWPAVEDALRNVARKINEQRQGNAQGKAKDASPPIDPDSAEVQQLKSAAMPLLWQLREDQKQEVRTLARIIGLEKVASAI
jgi:hypothetical protein